MTEILLRIGSMFFQFLSVMIIMNVLLRFINPEGKGPFAGFVLSMTEPLLQPLRRVLRVRSFDLSPFAMILLIEYVALPLYNYVILRLFG
ncbi:YggT family protein [Alkalibacter rhizosphaerae]|uniref:YggT family protein n=1 Tax=Alkalibacter rhizosphaerae TaxID=2815577 RepID=A0A974XHC7_9FIRM|nr:YggT family protein [Alkalibacter rhizosphaerae]QSX08760.1 YggT family protein [Alkalibacter rhizosphaerae]